MRVVKQIFTDLQATNGKKDKEKILQTHKNNTLLQIILQFVYDPMILSGLSYKKINKQVTLKPNVQINDILNCLNYLSSHNTGTDQDICNIQSFVNSQHPEFQSVYIQIVTKSLKLGCDAKTMNKVFGKGFIHTHEVQNAYPIEKYKLKAGEWFALSEKLNGIRGSYLDGKIISRQGHEISGLEHILKDIELLSLEDMFIDGELKRKNRDGVSDNENFRLTTSLINSDDNDKSEIEFVIFDIFPCSEFVQGESREKYQARLETFYSLKSAIDGLKVESLKVVDLLYTGGDKTKIDYYLDIMVEQNKEGLMLNRNTAYKCKRNNGILKVKRFYTCDVLCKRIEAGGGKYSDTLGAIVVDYKGFECGVGSGFTDEQRDFYWNNPDEIIGKIIQVKYKEESENKDGGLSLQFPIFECVRNDKTEPSYN